MKKLLALLALVLLCGCNTQPAATSTPIKVGSYNVRLQFGDKGTINAWENRRADLVKLVRKLDMDVFGMQEVCPGQAQYFREQLPEWEFIGDHRGADRKSDEASPVFFRKSRFEALKQGTFWLSEIPEVPGSKSWNTACTRVCSYLILKDKVTGRKFCFANTHTDHKSALAREKGMLLIVERMKEFGAGSPIIFTGDHNCRETEVPAQAVAKILNNAIYRSETTPRGPWRSFTGWKFRDVETTAEEALAQPIEVRNVRKGSPDGTGHAYEKYGARIDYIYVSPNIRVLDYETHNTPRTNVQSYPSDHFPVTATIVIED